MLYSVLLFIHILGGTVALVCAVGSVWVAKGQAAHKRWGMVYVMGMSLVSLSAWPMSILKPNLFLFLIACFSAYLVASGFLRAKNRSGVASNLDWFVALFGLAVGLAMLAYAGSNPAHKLHTVLIAFGILLSAIALRAVWGLKRQQFKGKQRIANHLTHMLAGTIATVTAVAVVNIRGVEPAWLVWLAPTVLITPVIIYWNIKTLGKATGA